MSLHLLGNQTYSEQRGYWGGGVYKGGGPNATPTVELLGGIQCRQFLKAQFIAAESKSDGANEHKYLQIA